MTKDFLKAGLLLFFLASGAFPQTPEKLSLKDAITFAIQRNPDIAKAEKEIDAAGGRIKQAGKISNPQVEISWNETPRNLNLGEADELDIGIVQEIEFPTKRSHRIDFATYDQELARLNLGRTKLIATARVKKAYYAALLNRELLQSIEEQLQLLRDFQNVVSARYQAGQSNYLDVVRAKVEITRLGNEVVTSRKEYQQALRQLNLVIGDNPDVLLVLTDTLSYVPMKIGRDSLIESLMKGSFSLEIAKQTVSRQQSFLSLATSSYLPDFSIGIFHQQRAEEPPFNANQFTGTTSKALGVQLGISVPLWFWKEPKGQVEEAAAFAEIATINQYAVERKAIARVLDSYDLLLVAETHLRNFDETLLGDIQDILSTAIDQYQNNQIDALNLFDVYRTYRATRVEYARALYNYAIALADLEVAAELPSED